MAEDWNKYIVQEEEPENKWDQFVVEEPTDKVDEFLTKYPDAETLTIAKEEKQKKKDPYMKDWLQRIGGAIMKVPEQLTKGAKFTETLYDAPGESVRYRLEQLGVEKETAGKIGDLAKTFKYARPEYWGLKMANKVNDAVKDTEGFKRLNETADKLNKESQRYDATITELIKEKDFDGAFGAIMLAGAESLPLSMIAAFGGPAGLGTLGTIAGAEKYDELSDRDDMDEAVKMGVSITIGGLEAATEMLGTAQIGGLVKNAFKGAGKEATRETLQAGLRAWFKGMYKKAGIWTAPIQEGMEEGVNALGGNIVARLSGEDPERGIGEGVLDQTLGGMGGGTYFTAAGGVGKAVNDIKGRLESEVKTEEKVPPVTAKEPSADTEKLPEVPKEQPPIPTYKIGEKEFETKDEFITEVEKYKGAEDTPNITVTNDQNTLDEVDKILTIKEEPSNARSTKEKIDETRSKEELVKEEEERLRVRGNEKDRLEAEKEEGKVKTRKLLVDEATDNLGFESEEAASTYINYLEETTGMKDNTDVGEPSIYLDVLREAANIIHARKGERSLTPEIKSSKTIEETINTLKKDQESSSKKEDKDMFQHRINTLEGYQENIQEIVDRESPMEGKEIEKEIPEVVYHRSTEEFDEFDKERIGTGTDKGWWGRGIYFHSDKESGKGYGDIVKEAKVELKNPIVLPVENSGKVLYDIVGEKAGLDKSFKNESAKNIIKEIGSSKFTEIAKELGHDGVVVNYAQGTKEIVAFDTQSIKQAVKVKPTLKKQVTKKIPVKRISAAEGKKLREMNKELKETKSAVVLKLTEASGIIEATEGTDADVIEKLTEAGFKVEKREAGYVDLLNGEQARVEEGHEIVIDYGETGQMRVDVESVGIILDRVKKKWPVTVKRPGASYPSKGRKVKHHLPKFLAHKPDGTLKTKEDLMDELEWRKKAAQRNVDDATNPELKKLFQDELDYISGSKENAEKYFEELIKEQENIERDETETIVPRDTEVIADEAESIGKEADVARTEEEITTAEQKIDEQVDEIDQKIYEQDKTEFDPIESKIGSKEFDNILSEMFDKMSKEEFSNYLDFIKHNVSLKEGQKNDFQAIKRRKVFSDWLRKNNERSELADTFDEFVSKKKENYKKEYDATDEDFADEYGENDLLREWREKTIESTKNGERLPDEVLDSFVEKFGMKDYQSTFRGAREQEGYVQKEVREEKGVSELAARSSEITKSFGLSGFRTTEGKEGTRSELAKEDIINWLNKEEKIELAKATDEKAKAEVSKKFNEQRALIKKAKARDTEAVRSILHDFIQRNRKALGALHGKSIPTIISRVNNKATTFVQLSNIMEYINDAFASIAQKQKAKTVGKIIEEASPEKKLEVKRSKQKAKQSYLNRIDNANIEKSKAITEQIERMDPESVENEIDKLREDEARLMEQHADAAVLEEIYDKMENLEFGRIWDMNQSQLDDLLAKIKQINKIGRTETKMNRIAAARKGFRVKKALTDMLGHPKFRAGHSKAKTGTSIIDFLTSFDVDFSALMNQAERISQRNFRWQWDNALNADINRDINTEKLGKYKEVYESIENDIKELKTSMQSMLEEFPVSEKMQEELKVINKSNVESFIDMWYEHVPEEMQKSMDNFTETIEEKYNTIFRKTKAWLPANFATGPLQRMFHTDLMHKAEEQMASDWYRIATELNDALKDIFGVSQNKLRSKIYELKTATIAIPYTDFDGKTDYELLTPMMAIQKWREYKMGDRMENFTKPQDINKLGSKTGMGWTEESFKALEESITPEMEKFGEWIVKKKREIIEEVQPAHVAQYGIKLDLTDNYITSIVVPENYTGDHSSLLEKQDVVRGISSDRFKRKTKNDYPLAMTDALDVFKNYAYDMMNFKNMSEPIRKLEHTFYDPSVKDHIVQRLSQKHYGEIVKYIDRWAGRFQRQNVEFLDDLLSTTSMGVLGFKTVVGAKQTFSSLLYASDPQMSVPRLVAGMTNMLKKGRLNESVIKLLDMQSYFTDRLGAQMGLDIALDPYGGKMDYIKDKGKKTVLRTAYEKTLSAKSKVTKHLPMEQARVLRGMFLKYGDRFPAVVAGGAYLKIKYKHFSRGKKLTSDIIEGYIDGETNKALDRALEEWSIMSGATQQSTRTSKVSSLRASGSVWRAVTQFLSGPAQLARNVMMAARNVKRGRNPYANMKAIMLNHLIVTALYAWSEVGFRTDLDDDDKKEFRWKMIIGPFKGITIWGRVLSLAMNIKFDKPWSRQTLTQTAVTDLIYDFAEGIIKLSGEEDEEKRKEYKRQIVTSLATLRGIPADELIDIYEVIEQAKTGDADIMELLMLRNPDKTTKKQSYKRGKAN